MSLENFSARSQEIGRAIYDKVESKYRITPANIPRFIYPIAQYVHELQPDYIYAFDSGARLPGLALHMMYQELYGSLPSVDHSIRFRRVSHKIPNGPVRKRIQEDIEEMIAAKPNPTVFILDDWSSTGRTITMARKMYDGLSGGQLNLHFGVLREVFTHKSEVCGDRYSIARSTWQHKKTLIGVAYSDLLEPYKTISADGVRIRQEIAASVKDFVSKIDK